MTIKLQNVSLSYNVPTESRNTLKDTILAIAKRKPLNESRLAIKDITLEISKGNILGIVGRNGAGKSSLLKIIAGILPPSQGNIKTIGKLAALIELGAGFHPELTAYENTIIYGRMLGTPVSEMRRNAEEILFWANLLERGHDPIRTFSSGMLARLGFAIATHQNPEILLVDEVLSVGDQDFQMKSRKRMNELLTSGCTVLLVSHDLNLISDTCKETIFLENGEIKNFGKTDSVLNQYRNSLIL
jgi:ABC-type polysaccharide/polyol phosphate transport system ATPase subunit